MSNFLISSYSLSSAPRSAVFRAQNDLRIAQKEVVTGRLADVGLTLGAGTSRSISLRADIEATDRQRQANALVGQRLDLMQNALSSIAETGESLRASLVAASGADQAFGVGTAQAVSALQQLMSGLNTNSGERFLFSGASSDKPGIAFKDGDGNPVEGYFAGSTAQVATQAAFDAFLNGRSPGDLSAADMDEFLSGSFSDLFADAPTGSWQAFSGISDAPVSNIVDGDERIDVAATASAQGFRDMAKAYVMLGDLGTKGLGKEARQLLTSRAAETLGTGLTQLTSMRGELGGAQSRLDLVGERLDARKTVLNVSIASVEGVDAYEASTRITNLTNLLESSYALTARLSRLSILNYL